MNLNLVLSSKFQAPANRKREAVRAAHDQDFATLLELLNHYLTLKSARKAQMSDDTRRLYAVAIKRFLEFCAGSIGQRLEVTRLEADDVETWLVSLQAEGIKPGSVVTYLHGVRALYRALIWAKAATLNPAGEVKPPKDPTPAHLKKSALSPALYRDLIAAPGTKFEADDPRQARDALLLALGGSGGLRAKEIISLNVPDDTIRQRRQKTNSTFVQRITWFIEALARGAPRTRASRGNPRGRVSFIGEHLEEPVAWAALDDGWGTLYCQRLLHCAEHSLGNVGLAYAAAHSGHAFVPSHSRLARGGGCTRACQCEYQCDLRKDGYGCPPRSARKDGTDA
jgi:integrase